jgi:hypothetical protein
VNGPSWELVDLIAEGNLLLEYDEEHELWVATIEDEDGDEDCDDERVGFELNELLARIADESADAPWISALVDQIEADRRVQLRPRHPRW